jgi:hypothetical protein
MILQDFGYKYRGIHYSSREDALENMLLNSDYTSTIEFEYHDNVFRNIDWTIEPDIDIDLLYKIRAQQLREKYSYLILSFSGGIDSVQMLETFLKHNIYFDEIQISHYGDGTSKFDSDQIVRSGLTEFLEYDLTAKKYLKKVENLCPNTKITILDATKFVYNQYTSGKFENINTLDKKSEVPANTYRLYSMLPRSLMYYLNYYNIKINRPPKNTGFIRGFEKPIIFPYMNGSLGFSFYDISMHSHSESVLSTMAIENFYWSPDAPLIPIKQSHMLKRLLETNEFFYTTFLKAHKILSSTDTSVTISPAIKIERVYGKIIYPDWSAELFVGEKPTKQNPEITLVEKLGGSHHYGDVAKELEQDKLNKYKMIQNKKQFRKLLFTQPYNLGKLQINHRKQL